MFRYDGDVMKSLEFLWYLNTPLVVVKISGSESWEGLQKLVEYYLVLVGISNINFQNIQTADIKGTRYLPDSSLQYLQANSN